MERGYDLVRTSSGCVQTPLLKDVESLGFFSLPCELQDEFNRFRPQLDDDVANRIRLNEGVKVHLKLENFQNTGSFKPRGIVVQMEKAWEKASAGDISTPSFVTMSAGNYGKAFALACKQRGIRGTVLMPDTAPDNRQVIIQNAGCDVVRVPTSQLMCKVRELVDKKQMTFLHPFDDLDIIAGYASVGIEICDEADPDVVLVCCGGGGLVSGIAAALRLRGRDKCRIYAVEPETANTMERSLLEDSPASLPSAKSIAAGLAPPLAGVSCFRHVKAFANGVITVTDEEMVFATKLLFLRGLVVEPSGAAAFASLIFNKVPYPNGVIVAVVTGGNVTPTEMTSIFKMNG